MPARRLLFFPLAALLLLTGCVTSGRSAFIQRDVAAFAPADSVDVEAYQAEYEGHEGVFTHWEQTAEHVVTTSMSAVPNWHYYRDTRIRYVILDPEAEWLATFRTEVEPGGQFEGVAIRVTSPDGSVSVFSEGNLAKEESSGKTVYKMAYPNVEAGTVVEENVRVRYKAGMQFTPPLEYDIPLQSSIPIERLSYRFGYPSWWALKLKQVETGRTPAFDTEYDEEQKKTFLVHKALDVPAVADEVYAPYFKERAEYLAFQITELKLGSLDYTARASWEEMADGFKKYAFRRGGFFSNPVRRALDDLDLQGLSDEEKLDLIVTYVQTTIEPGSSSKDDFNTVLKEQRGSVYLITGLAQAMLEEAGVPATYVLIHSARDGYFDRSYITGSQLYIPAVAVEIEGRDRVAFPWVEGLPVTHVPEHFQGQAAMQIDADGFAGFMVVPTGNAADNATEENFTVALDEDGVVEVEEERVFRGSAAYALRTALRDLEDDERDEVVEELLTYTDGEVQDLEYTIDNEGAPKQPLVIRLTYGIDNLVTVTPEEVLFQTGGLFSPASSVSLKVDTEERESPIRIYYDEVQNKRIELRYPAHWSLATELDEVAVENQFGTLASRYTVGDGRMEADYALTLRQSEAPPSDFGTLLDLTGSRSRLNLPTLVFSVES
ncbi:MAG: hypothetical protein AAGI91_02480 [Bacteroidota bacterium]